MHTQADTTKSLIVVPNTAIGITGAGIRTSVFISALAKLGPTSVLVIGDPADHQLESILDRCEKVHHLDANLVANHKPRWQRRINFAISLIFPILRYPMKLTLSQHIDSTFDNAEFDAVAFRYFSTFRLFRLQHMEHKAVLLVDVDDRDDTTFFLQFDEPFRKWINCKPLRFLLGGRIRSMMKSQLTISDHVWFSAKEDLEALSIPQASIAYNIPGATPGRNIKVTAPSTASYILFVGSETHNPNVEGVLWFLANCWQNILEVIPDTRFQIIGTGNWNKRLADYATSPSIDIIGFAPDLANAYNNARLVICPIFVGSGSKIKVIEACSFKRPVVSTSHSARGFGNSLLDHLAISDDETSFAAACVKFLQDPQVADRSGEELSEIQSVRFSRDTVVSQVSKDVAEAIHRKHLTNLSSSS